MHANRPSFWQCTRYATLLFIHSHPKAIDDPQNRQAQWERKRLSLMFTLEQLQVRATWLRCSPQFLEAASVDLAVFRNCCSKSTFSPLSTPSSSTNLSNFISHTHQHKSTTSPSYQLPTVTQLTHTLTTNSKMISCYICHGVGHIASMCPARGDGRTDKHNGCYICGSPSRSQKD